MFSCEEFRLLDEDLQAQMLWMDGAFLMTRETKRAKIELFSLYNFYVEIFYEGEELLFNKAFDNVMQLDPYLQLINIDFIYEGSKGK